MLTLRHLSAAVGTALLITLSTPVLAFSAESPETVTWGMVPANSDGEPDGRVSFRIKANPGEVVNDQALVQNFSDQDLTFDIDASDGMINQDTGTFDILQTGEEAADAGTWFEVQDSIVVPAQETAVVPFTITIPNKVTPGDHPAGITAGLSQTTDAGESAAVGFNARVGLRTHIRINGDLAPTVKIENFHPRYVGTWNPFAPGKVRLSYTVKNEGNVRIQSEEYVKLSGPFGLAKMTVADPAIDNSEILPGGTKVVSTEIDGVWPLAFINISVDTNATEIGDDDWEGIHPLNDGQTNRIAAIPWTQGIILLLIGGFIIWQVRSRKAKKARFDKAIKDAKAEAIKDMTDKSDSSSRGSEDLTEKFAAQ